MTNEFIAIIVSVPVIIIAIPVFADYIITEYRHDQERIRKYSKNS